MNDRATIACIMAACVHNQHRGSEQRFDVVEQQEAFSTVGDEPCCRCIEYDGCILHFDG